VASSEIGDLYVILRAVTDPFKTGMKTAVEDGEAATTSIGGAFQKLAGIGVVAGGAALAIGAASVKWASDFQTEMTKLYTAAGLSQQQLDAVHMTSSQLNDKVLQLGDSVGYTGTQMAEALYHPISAGLDLKSSLEVVKYAAEEARISGASLNDTTYSLSSVMKAFNKDATDAGPTMAELNAIVGEGDMRFQDFNESIKNWAPTAAQMGMSVSSMGAGLAYLTDRGNSAEVASTRLTMGIAMMTTPSSKAADMLIGLGAASSDVKASSAAMEEAMKAAGITQNQLAVDLQKPDGLYVALNHLKTGLEKAGVSGTEADSVLSKIFGGGRSDKAIMSLMQNLDGLKTKYDAITTDSTPQKFQSAWEQTQQTFNVKLKEVESTLVNLGIKLGTLLLPYVEKFLGWVQQGVGWLMQHKGAVEVLAGAIGTTLVAAVIALGGALISAMGPEIAIAAGIMALGAALVYAYNHSAEFREIVNEVGQFLAGAFKAAWQQASQVIHWFATTVLPAVKDAIRDVIVWFKAHKQDFVDAWDTVVKAVQRVVKWFDDNVVTWVRDRVDELIKWWDRNSQSVHEVWSVVWKLVETAVRVWWDGFMKPTLSVIESVWRVVWDGIKDALTLVWDAIKDVATTGIHWVENTISLVLDIITGKWGRVWGDLQRLVGQALNDVVSTIGDLASNFGTLLWDAGANIIKGLIGGIKSMIGGVGHVMSDITSEISSFLPHSPAKQGPLSGRGSPDLAGSKIGSMLADGIHQSVPSVSRATGVLAGAASLSVGPGTGLGSLAVGPTSAAAASAPSSDSLPPIVVTIDGRKLFEILQVQALRYGRRNPSTGLTYT
jgi:TP901 family phage tail tape measure protein